jgi:hypothetical protein
VLWKAAFVKGHLERLDKGLRVFTEKKTRRGE